MPLTVITHDEEQLVIKSPLSQSNTESAIAQPSISGNKISQLGAISVQQSMSGNKIECASELSINTTSKLCNDNIAGEQEIPNSDANMRADLLSKLNIQQPLSEKQKKSMEYNFITSYVGETNITIPTKLNTSSNDATPPSILTPSKLESQSVKDITSHLKIMSPCYDINEAMLLNRHEDIPRLVETYSPASEVTTHEMDRMCDMQRGQNYFATQNSAVKSKRHKKDSSEESVETPHKKKHKNRRKSKVFMKTLAKEMVKTLCNKFLKTSKRKTHSSESSPERGHSRKHKHKSIIDHFISNLSNSYESSESSVSESSDSETTEREPRRPAKRKRRNSEDSDCNCRHKRRKL
eukprot:TRINITY_DN11981_c0_g1_i5.p1 TRINITY_DN11981_c0_g1~~TRINITY_DN11981_c0_g1_i5.p1  ORF type:complete len:371 (-),score=50.03 TRINITY_DN11981_c0_g1_i5:125-1177(-)